MSSPHPPQVKWFSFLLLLLTLILELPSPATSGECEERCDKNRLPGYTGAYTLNCKEFYDKRIDIHLCESDCSSCPSEICFPGNPGIFHCPPFDRDIARCKHHCDTNRPVLTSTDYDLNCFKKYSSIADIEYCRSFCTDCPREICVGSIPDEYKCPSENGLPPPTSRICLNPCNKNRPEGTTKAYKLSCIKEYSTVEDLIDCRNDCKFCTVDICNPYNPDIFHCPAVQPPTSKPTTSQSGQPTWILVLLIVLAVLIVVPCIGTGIYCCFIKKKARVRIEQNHGISGGVGYPTYLGQQQQPYPMNFTYDASEPSTSSLSIVSSASTSK